MARTTKALREGDPSLQRDQSCTLSCARTPPGAPHTVAQGSLTRTVNKATRNAKASREGPLQKCGKRMWLMACLAHVM